MLVTCVCSKKGRENASFFPLTVEYQERTFAAGKIPGGFFKREGRPSEKAILTARMIDRPIRPLFPSGMLNETQVVATILSVDDENDPDILALVGTSAALTISNIPFEGPIGAVRVGLVNDELVANPTFEEMDNSELDLVIVANETDVIMLEAGANEISEEKLVDAIKFGHENIKPVLKAQNELQGKCGRVKREDVTLTKVDPEVFEKVSKLATDKMKAILVMPDKSERMDALDDLKSEMIALEVEAGNDKAEADVKTAMSKLEKSCCQGYNHKH